MTDINLKSSTIEKGLDLAKGFIQSVIKPSMDEVGELFSDTIKVWRVKNQIRNIEKVKAIVDKEGITTKAINMKVLFPYLDAVALEDDETLQDMWANLFVNYIDGEKNLTSHVYPEILRQLSRDEVFVLKILCQDITTEEYNSTKKLPSQESLNNLNRLGLVIPNGVPIALRDDRPSVYTIRESYSIQTIIDYYRMSSFGVDFYLACTRET